jgi:hypothetical protein
MKPIATAALALVLLTVGCAGSGNWTRPDTSKETAAADYSACQSLAREATQRDDAINADILASRGADWQRAGMLDAQRDSMATEKRKHASTVIGNCMTAKGYREAP